MNNQMMHGQPSYDPNAYMGQTTQMQQTPQMYQQPAYSMPGQQAYDTNAYASSNQPTQSVYTAPVQMILPVQNTEVNSDNSNKRTLDSSGIITHAVSQLFEVQGAVDFTDQFPFAFAFIQMVPYVNNPTKATGKSYDMKQKIVIKFSIEELYGMAAALEDAAIYGQTNFVKFSDPKKANVNANAGAETKKLAIGAEMNGQDVKIFINVSWGQKKIPMALKRYEARGLAWQLRDVAHATNMLKFDYDRNRIKNYKKV
jgi:hypothetical protein